MFDLVTKVQSEAAASIVDSCEQSGQLQCRGSRVGQLLAYQAAVRRVGSFSVGVSQEQSEAAASVVDVTRSRVGQLLALWAIRIRVGQLLALWATRSRVGQLLVLRANRSRVGQLEAWWAEQGSWKRNRQKSQDNKHQERKNNSSKVKDLSTSVSFSYP